MREAEIRSSELVVIAAYTWKSGVEDAVSRTKVIEAKRVDNVSSPNHHNHAHPDETGPSHFVPYRNPYHRCTILLPTTARTPRTLHEGGPFDACSSRVSSDRSVE